MALLISFVILLSLSYTLGLFVVSRRSRPLRPEPPEGLLFTFLVPCLNEELVVGKSLERLLSLPVPDGCDVAVLVIDDGSDDATADVVRSFADPRVHLLQRVAPEARQGKGEALNAAFRYLRSSPLTADRRSEDVIVAVVDADGRLAQNAVFEVAPWFADERAGAVQVGVRMYNADEGLLARLQDVEFVVFTEIFQRARQKLGSVGLGGNGQFARLAALESLGDAPWTSCLTEDLDLGIRLLAKGWQNSYCPTTHVSQQAVTSVRRLVRQRSRWFQGHLQCWARIPLVLRSQLPLRTAADLLQHLMSPALVLLTSLLLPVTLGSLAVVTVAAPVATAKALVAGGGVLLAAWYLLAFGLAPFYAFVYWLREPSVGILRAFAYAHAYTLYGYLWFGAGWWAVARIARRKQGWAKTARTVDAAPSSAPEASAPVAAPAAADAPVASAVSA